MSESGFSRDVAVVGGCGHVGLPFALVLADRGLDVTLFDVDRDSVELVNAGMLPFDEAGAAPVLERTLAAGRLRATTDPAIVREAEVVVVVIGTPIDEHLNPDLHAVQAAITEIAEHLVDGQLLILRSTVYPGVTAMVEQLMTRLGVAVDVAFCPERIAEGRAMTELTELPQIVAARSQRAHRTERRSSSRCSPTTSCTSNPKRQSSRSSSPTPGATSSSRPQTSST